MLKWGIISTGTIARRFAEVLNQMGGEAVLKSVASRDIEKAESFAKEFNAGTYYGS